MTRGGHENCTSESFETVLITKERERESQVINRLSIDRLVPDRVSKDEFQKQDYKTRHQSA